MKVSRFSPCSCSEFEALLKSASFQIRAVKVRLCMCSSRWCTRRCLTHCEAVFLSHVSFLSWSSKGEPPRLVKPCWQHSQQFDTHDFPDLQDLRPQAYPRHLRFWQELRANIVYATTLIKGCIQPILYVFIYIYVYHSYLSELARISLASIPTNTTDNQRLRTKKIP